MTEAANSADQRPGRRALAFIQWAVDTQAVVDGRFAVITCSQKELMVRHGAVGSQGTVAWYINQLRQAGIITDTRPITVDLDTLAQFQLARGARPAPTTPGRGGAVVDGPWLRPGPHSDRSSDLDSSFGGGGGVGAGGPDPLLELLVRHGQLLAELTAVHAELLTAVLGGGPAAQLTDGRELTDQDVAQLADRRDNREIRDIRESHTTQKEVQEGRGCTEDHEESLPAFLPAPANRANRDHREPQSATGREPGCGGAKAGRPMSYAEVDALVEPLKELCRRTGRPDRLDMNGRRILAALTREQLAAGVESLRKEAAADTRITRPVGLLVRRALDQDDSFTPPPRPDRGPVNAPPGEDPAERTTDQEADDAVTALETDPARADELAALDAAVAADLEASGLNQRLRERIMGSPPMLAAHRRLVWRQQHPQPVLGQQT